MPTSSLGSLTDAAQQAVDLFGDTSGVVMVTTSPCIGGRHHVMVGADTIETLAELVVGLSELTPVAQIEDSPIPAWIGETNGLRLCLYLCGDLHSDSHGEF